MNEHADDEMDTCTATELAKIAGVSAPVLPSLVKRGFIEPSEGGRFDVNAAVRGLLRYWRQRGEIKATRLAEEKAKHARTSRRLAEAKLRVAQLEDRARPAF